MIAISVAMGNAGRLTTLLTRTSPSWPYRRVHDPAAKLFRKGQGIGLDGEAEDTVVGAALDIRVPA